MTASIAANPDAWAADLGAGAAAALDGIKLCKVCSPLYAPENCPPTPLGAPQAAAAAARGARAARAVAAAAAAAPLCFILS